MISLRTLLYLAYALLTASSLVGAEVPGQQPDVSPSLQQILNQAHKGPLYTYPTSLTQGIIPKGIHSHNDYWRDVPFYTALSVGAISVEADVWLYNGTLYVGHEQAALTPARTFESLYINPILDVLKRQNPTNSSFVRGTTRNGVYDTNGGQTLYLFVDLKTDGASTWPVVVKALEPLRKANYLSTTNGTHYTSGPVTVIGTGNTPLSQIQPVPIRDYFYDAPLASLAGTFANITSLVSPLASGDFAAIFGDVVSPSGLNATQLALLRQQIAVGEGKGIGLRYWDQPGWPLATRNAVWRQLWSEGAALINVDDLPAAAGLGEDW